MVGIEEGEKEGGGELYTSSGVYAKPRVSSYLVIMSSVCPAALSCLPSSLLLLSGKLRVWRWWLS